MKYILTLIFLLSYLALAQDYNGTFVQQDDPSTVITLTSQADGYTGTLLNEGVDEFPIEAYLQEGYLAGYLRGTATGYNDLFFIAQLSGDSLELAVAPIDEAGNPIESEAEAYVFVRSESNGAGNPLSSAPVAQNPLAPQVNTDLFSGDYEGQAFHLSLQAAEGGYQGTILMNGQTYPLEAALKGEQLLGSFSANGQSFAFEATLNGSTLTLVSEGTSYTLTKSATSTNPLAGGSSTNPLTAAASPVIAKGSYADLTEDNALAVYEAYVFSLQQLGYTQSFTDADKQTFMDFAVQEYPNTDQETQLTLQRARDVWTNVQANWDSASLEDQRGFVLAVLALIHGEEAVQQSLGTNAASSHTDRSGEIGMLNEMGCASVETCMSYLDPEGYEDMVNAQNCWSGCDYEPETNTFYYDEPSYDSYDY